MEARIESCYKIGELAGMFGTTARTLRYYEELGLIKSSDRAKGVHRRYPEQNIIYLKRVAQLKSYGLSLVEIREFFELAEADRTGESCKRLLIRKYGERIAEAEAAREAARRLVEELRWHVRQLEEVEDFFECPGKQCGNCRHADVCDMRS
jgi:DNA-binding transcriptional MerR regulator